MERISVGGRVYTDPDVLSLIRTRVDPVDPEREVIRRARELNQKLRELGGVDDPRRRMEILASLAGIKVSPMVGAGVGKTHREALVYSDSDGSHRVYYDPTFPEGRINFSIGHEISHTFFPGSANGARFRSMCTDDSKEGNELERLCHRGAAELLMPQEEFAQELRGEMGLSAVPRLCQRFGSSYEATVYRMATAFAGFAVAGLLQYLRFTIASRKWFDILNATDPATLTDIQRASRFLYLQKNCFGGLVIKQHFHYGITQPSNFNPERIPKAIEETHRRLARVQIESLPYEQVLEKYDRPTTLFYLDPPYWDRKLYKFNFKEENFRVMAELLGKLTGRFILSLDDHPKVREVFKPFQMERIEIHYTAQRQTGSRFGELLIMNFQARGETKIAQIES